MARKKSRTPPPPRPVQAPRARREPWDPRRTRLGLIALGVAIAAGAVAVVLALTLGGGGGKDADLASLVAAGCTVSTLPDQGRRHATELPKDFKYNSFPPTSGIHHGQPAIWNIYDRPVPQFVLVHNLEHGGVAVQYGEGVQPETVKRIADWFSQDPNGMVVAPLPKLGTKIALTAWTHLATCRRFDEAGFSDFRDAYRFEAGPEGEFFGPRRTEPGT